MKAVDESDTVREALLWEPLEAGAVRCALCSHRCRVAPGRAGLCGVRENRGGALHTLVYGRLVAESVDPVEKKPLYHFQPGSLSYSIATAGCNFRCAHCQNYAISQAERHQGRLPGRFAAAEAVVERALEAGCRSLSYTYTEPTVFFEYALDCMKLARAAGLRNVFVSNGYMTPECLDLAAPWLDGANVDLKSFRDDFYREVCGGRLEPVLGSIRGLVERGVWVEVTTLVIPRRNDAPDELRGAARFLAGVSRDLPWHVTGFYPTYRMTDEPPTPPSTLLAAREIGLEEGLRFVYAGNRPGSGGEDTPCPSCGRVVLARRGFSVTRSSITAGGACSACGASIPGVEPGGAP
ncbi:MAG: AmmeMemoRadiSam system radical SAM enzyme [Deltaproteobacteria bacterium]|nr:AmmeMemoRadiSam system radical SAM enzyme [Deltaproteobacteria bacterium]